MSDYRIVVKVNGITGERSYTPQKLYPNRYGGGPAWENLREWEYDVNGHYVDGVWTLEWALDAIVKQSVRDAWKVTHYLYDDGRAREYGDTDE